MHIIAFDLHNNTCKIDVDVPVSHMKLRGFR